MPPDRLQAVRHVKVQKENEEACAQIVRDLENVGLTNSALYKSLSADTTEVLQPSYDQELQVHPQIRAMFFNKGLQKGNARTPTDGNTAAFYFENIICDDEERLSIFIKTMGQSTNPEWFSEKKNRISASKSRQEWK